MDFGLLLIEEEERRRRRQGLRIRRKTLRDANNPFNLEEHTFVKLFRINKEIAANLMRCLGPDLNRTKSDGLPIAVVVLTAVRFFAVGSYQRSIGQEFNLAIGQSTVSNCVRTVSRAIVERLMATYVGFPNTAAARQEVARGFLEKFGLPDCLGCIDCTHVAVVTPYCNDPNNPPETYRNRKGFYSLNVQLVCDVNLKIINVNAKFPGSTHDAHIFNMSAVKEEMNRLCTHRIGHYFLIGDSGYAKEAYMLTPILPTPGEGTPEGRYNRKIASIRNCVERTNGVLKAVFRCLRKDRVLHYQPDVAAMIVLSCCTIYNMMHHFRLELPEFEVPQDLATDPEPVFQDPNLRPRQAALQRQGEIVQLINNL